MKTIVLIQVLLIVLKMTVLSGMPWLVALLPLLVSILLAMSVTAGIILILWAVLLDFLCDTVRGEGHD